MPVEDPLEAHAARCGRRATSTWVMSPVTTDLRPEADAGEEHLHLLGRGVLGLVEDDEAGVERAPPHEGERRHLHRLALEQLLRALGLDHVVQRVVQRPQVRVDLGHEVAGQEAEPLTGLDRRAGEDDALHLLGLQRLHRHGDRQPALAGAGRTEPEGDDVASGWRRRSASGRRSSAAPCGPWRRAHDLVGEHLARALGRPHHVDRRGPGWRGRSAGPAGAAARAPRTAARPARPPGRRW